jgi:multicomponent Na+:H+ antiporter subunit D
VPFHFWLADAQAVAPSPVSVVFSGAMVSVPLFGITRLMWQVFGHSIWLCTAAHALLLAIGVASTLIGGAMALLQRHRKRLLAFSTIAHTGTMLIGIGLLRPQAFTGVLKYLVGHGLVKGGLFMLVGIIIALVGDVDELRLRGKARALWPAGVAMAFAGLLLAGAPAGEMHIGADSIEHAAYAQAHGWLTGVCCWEPPSWAQPHCAPPGACFLA